MTKEAKLPPCPFCSGAVMFRKALWPSDGCVDAIIHSAPGVCGLVEFSDGTADESIIAKWSARGQPQSSAGLADAVRNYFKLWDRCGGSEAIAADLFAAARQNMRAALADTRPDRTSK